MSQPMDKPAPDPSVGTPQPDDDLRCGGCGGPHRFDTSVPSVLWNRVIRPLGGSEYLCTACIVSAFARAGVSFTATLYGDGFHGLPIAIEINGQTSTVAHEIQEENNALRGTLSRIHDEAEAQLASACRPPDSKNVGTPPSADEQTGMCRNGSPHYCPNCDNSFVDLSAELARLRAELEIAKAETTRAVLRYTAKGYAAGENAPSKYWRERAETAEASYSGLLVDLRALAEQWKQDGHWHCGNELAARLSREPHQDDK